ncbi:MAG TPA: PD-(D/E)XK nuclease family protein [Solirubrobacterales bacterium]|nr:PD-(D/E)XK nuclease family protein [Solirubrobacterales bacterium]
MALKLIAGPPNSGRTGAILDAFRASSGHDPVLVVPTVDDVERFEGELTRGGEAVIGASVGTFDRLFALVTRAVDAPAGTALTRTQRRRIAREAVARTNLKLLAASASRPGFPGALEELVSELRAALVDPATLTERAREAGPYEVEIATLYEAYAQVQGELGRHDAHSLAAAAISGLRANPDAWAARPVLLYGFDDLTAEQLELVRALARAAPVTVALPWEDRELLTKARGSLFAELRDTDGVSIERLEAQPRFTASGTLFELARRYGESTLDAEPLENDGGLALLASAGELAEVETVGAEIARLLDAGVPAGEMAIVLRDPSSSGPLFRRVLSRFEIPVAVQADLALTRTVTGAGLVALLEAAVGRRRAADLLAYLRTPGIASPNRVDWFQRTVLRGRLRTADEAIEAWIGEGDNGSHGLPAVEKLREAGSGPELLREAGRQARWIAESAIRRQGAVARDDRALELRAGAEIERALGELADLDLPHSPADAIAAVAGLQVPMWRGPTEGRVRVISPYRARARRVAHLFVCSLQDGDFPRRDTGGPLLSDDARAALALPPRKQAEIEDRYLFSVCLSRPKERLWLSWRNADDEGGATARSPFVDEVRDLLAPALPSDTEERDEALAAEARGRGLADSVFEPGDAPCEDELARAEAASGQGAPVPEPVRRRIATRLASARERIVEERRRPGPLRLGPVLEAVASQELFGSTTLEEYAECPYRWFVDHELSPRRIGPEEEPLTAGQVAHRILEGLYAEPPSPEGRPTPATLAAWIERARELTETFGPSLLPRERADTAAALHRVEGLVLAFLADEAETPAPFVPVPDLAEARFGFPDSEKPALPVGTGAVHGQIDRIDLGPGGEALVQDYKSGTKVDGGKGMLDRGKLQLQLYLLAARELWGLELAGGLYRALGARNDDDRKPKGLLRKSLKEELAGLHPRQNDHLDDEAFEAALEAAREKTEGIIASIQAGDIGRRPIGGSCPRYCHFQPICRRERGVPEEEPEREEEEE